ncbi:MAG: response regulator FixJ [Candidatus Methanolliviera sp. GoM_oil]|nr:MAG: response regulator FixJ [Candidatus Methanolliviera sp. GoM_oil]
MRDKPVVVLLVEDEEAHVELVKKAFVKSGSEWEINHVSNLEDTFKWLNENDPPSLIIADHLLPDGSGIDLLGKAKRPEDVGIPVIILTGHGTEELAVRSLKSGAMDYVVKSTERFEEMPWIAERVLREWKNITELREKDRELKEAKEYSPRYLPRCLIRYVSSISMASEENLETYLERSRLETWT